MARIMPGVQMPHWAPPFSRKHCWMGWSFSLMAMPSMVVMLCAFGLQDGDEAGVDEVSVEDDGAGSAFAFSAAFFGAGEVEVFAEDVEEALHRWGFDGLFAGR